MPNNHPFTLFCLYLLFICFGTIACSRNLENNQEPSQQSPPTLTESPKNSTEPESNLQPTPTPPTAQTTPETPTVTRKNVKVFFPKTPNSNSDFTYVEPVWRTTTSEGIASFAINQLIQGPTESERQKGFINAIELTGNSNCSGNFTLSISQGVATLQFCKTVVSRGIGDDARAMSALKATLQQFSTIQSVIILDKNKNCFGDQSGENRCLVPIKTSDKLTQKSKLTINGIGSVKVGMTVQEASRAAGVKILQNESSPDLECSYYKPAGQLDGILFMVTEGHIARVDINTKAVTTLSGAGIGDTETHIKSLYPGQIEVTPHHYVQKGHYLTFVPKRSADQNYRIVFETDGEYVTTVRAGKLPEVQWIEGCS